MADSMTFQYLALALALAAAAAIATAIVGIARGRTPESVSWLLSASLCAILLAFSALLTWLAVAGTAFIANGMGMLDVGGTPHTIARMGTLLRMAAAVLAVICVALAFAATRRAHLEAALRRAAPDIGRLAAALRADVHRAFGDDSPRWPALLLLAVVLAGTALRVRLALLPMSYDESITVVFFASRSPFDILSDYAIPNNHILHTLLAHISARAFGSSELAVRLPALAAGIALVPLTGWLAGKWFGRGAAVVAAALVAAAPTVVEYSAQARGYTLTALLVLLAFLAVTYAVEARSILAWAIHALATAAALFTIPTALMGAIAVGAWSLLSLRREPRERKRLIIASACAAALTIALYLPAIARSGFRSLLGNAYVRPLAPRELLARAAAELVKLHECWAGAAGGVASAIVIGLALVAIAERRRDGWPAARLAAGIVAAIAILLLAQRVVPPTRTLLFAFPLIAILAAGGAARLARRAGARAPIVLVAVGLAIFAGWTGAYLVRRGFVEIPGRQEGARTAGEEGDACCAEGYFADAEAAARWTSRATTDAHPLVVHFYSGLAETTRFYLMRERVPIGRLHPYRASEGLAQLEDYPEIFLMARRAALEAETMAAAARVLGVAESELAAMFVAPEPAEKLPTAVIVRLRRRAEYRPSPREGRERYDLFLYPQ